jgi:lactate dehydrogenase-like 2-hydroxyacid dehydrogenase
MPHRLLIPQGALLPALQKRLENKYECYFMPKDPAEKSAFLRDHGKGVEALATNAGVGASADLVDALPDIKVISSMGVGLDAIDLPAMRERGIAVGYTPDVLNDCVADLAFTLLANLTRRINVADAFVRRGDWLNGGFPMATRISGKRLGILGMGRIGSVIAKRATGFDMEVRYHNRKPVEGSALGYVGSAVELAQWADFLVVASAGGASTRSLVSADVLDALGPQGFLINVSRGSVVDQAALIERLANGRIAGAGLDVYENEPNVPAALTALDNVVLTPHVASNTQETRAAMMQRVEDNLDSFFAGRGVVSSAL